MQNWLNFLNFIFWLSLISFISNFNNFLRLLFYSELTWIILYCFVLAKGSTNDDLTILTSSILILGLAGVEYGIGILIIIIFKQINKKTDFDETNNLKNNNNINYNNNSFINRYIWKI